MLRDLKKISFMLVIISFIGISLISGCDTDNSMLYTQPYLVTPKPATDMYICWLTKNKPQTSIVKFWSKNRKITYVTAKNYVIQGMKTVDGNGNYTVDLPVYQQIAHLQGLKPGTRYFYQAITDRSITMEYDFKTAPAKGKSFKFVLLSDLQLKPQSTDTVRVAGQYGADFILFNGDMQNTPYKAGEWFTVENCPEENDKRWFNILQQTENGTRLLQYTPIFPTPGNHEFDQQERLSDPALAQRDKMSMSIYMQLFRPLYGNKDEYVIGSTKKNQGEAGANGKHWYSVNYGDLHIISLSINRYFAYPAETAPGWFLFDDINKDSLQYNWLKKDLQGSSNMKFKWVTQHWHMFNRGHATDVPYTNPVPSEDDPTVMTYPADKDYLMNDIKPLFETYGVNGVSFGHSHVYERYVINNVNYIEAATIGNTYREENDPECSGQDNGIYCPVIDECRFRSFMIVTVDKQQGMTAQGIQASEATDDSGNPIGFIGRIFDTFSLNK